MKKLIFSIPILFLFIHLMFGGLGIWTQDLTGSGPIWQQGIAINPTNQLIMYAASNTQGMWKTTNGGLNWTQINTGITNLTLNCVSISRSNPNALYCGGGAAGIPNGMYRTIDAGATWTAINSGIAE